MLGTSGNINWNYQLIVSIILIINYLKGAGYVSEGGPDVIVEILYQLSDYQINKTQLKYQVDTSSKSHLWSAKFDFRYFPAPHEPNAFEKVRETSLITLLTS